MRFSKAEKIMQPYNRWRWHNILYLFTLSFQRADVFILTFSAISRLYGGTLTLRDCKHLFYLIKHKLSIKTSKKGVLGGDMVKSTRSKYILPFICCKCCNDWVGLAVVVGLGFVGFLGLLWGIFFACLITGFWYKNKHKKYVHK